MPYVAELPRAKWTDDLTHAGAVHVRPPGLPPGGLVVLQTHYVGSELLHEVPVVGDEQNRAGELVQCLEQDVLSFDVEIIRRLVERSRKLCEPTISLAKSTLARSPALSE